MSYFKKHKFQAAIISPIILIVSSIACCAIPVGIGWGVCALHIDRLLWPPDGLSYLARKGLEDRLMDWGFIGLMVFAVVIAIIGLIAFTVVIYEELAD